MDKVKNLKLLDEHIENLNAQIDSIISSGSAKNADKLFDMIQAIESCYHNEIASDYRSEQKRRTHWIDTKHPESIDLKKNKLTIGLFGTKGGFDIGGALFQAAIVIGGIYTNVDVKTISRILTMAQGLSRGFSEGVGALASANQNIDQTRSSAVDFAIEREKNEIRDHQDAHQSAKSHQQEAHRRKKEAQDARANTDNSIIRALGG